MICVWEIEKRRGDSVCECVCMCVCMPLCKTQKGYGLYQTKCVCVCVCVPLCRRVDEEFCVYMHICVCVCVSVYMYVWEFVCVYDSGHFIFSEPTGDGQINQSTANSFIFTHTF